MGGGQPAIRGYLVQTLIALLEAVDDQRQRTSVTLEPNVDSDKVDILWQFPDRRRPPSFGMSARCMSRQP